MEDFLIRVGRIFFPLAKVRFCRGVAIFERFLMARTWWICGESWSLDGLLSTIEKETDFLKNIFFGCLLEPGFDRRNRLLGYSPKNGKVLRKKP
jgi:hypothetical protein